MSYSKEIVKSNVIRLINHLGCENGMQVDELKRRSDYDHPVNELPGKHTINNLKDGKVDNVKDHTFEGFVRAYNKLFNTSITIYDFKETVLPFESIRTIPDLYEGTYYLYDYWKNHEKLLYGLANFHIVNNQYKVKIILRIFDQETLHDQSLLHIISNPQLGYNEYMSFFNNSIGNNKRMTYYEGNMELNQDFCVIQLKDIDQQYSIHDQTIFIRRFHYDYRDRLQGTIGIKVFNNNNFSIMARRLIFSSIELDIHDPYIANLLTNTDTDITDEQEYGLYKYIKSKRNG